MNQFYYFLFAILFISCNSSDKQSSEELSKEYPHDFMFMQRAYPSGNIKTDALKKALQWKRQQTRSAGGSWEFVGPVNVGGRVTDIEIPVDQSETYYLGTASGGIFKTTDAGSNWSPIFDDQGILSIGDMEISRNNTDLIWVGTGEVNPGGGSLAYDGDGIYKSTDGGATWEVKGLPNVGSIGKILVDPNDDNTVYVGAMGPLFRNDTNRGVYKSIDGGDTWEQKLFVSDSTGVIDMANHPSNSNILYAASWERVRRPERNDYFGETSRIYRTIDGGNNWTELTNGLPTASTNKGRISIDISQSNPDVLYAHFTDSSGITGIYKTMDGGDSWTTLNSGNIGDASYEWWFGGLFIDPLDENTVYYTGFETHKTTDGGNSWNGTFNNAHVDQHVVAFNASVPGEVLLGNDGGFYKSDNAGATWTKDETLPITQFYRLYVDPSNEDKVYGGAQDNNTIRTETGSSNDWQAIYGGDGFQPLVDATNTNVIYASYQYGNFGKSTNNGASFTNYGSLGSRTNWNTPMTFDPSDSQVLYYGANQLFKTTNAAGNWNAISPDLTNGPGGGNLNYGTITTIDVSPFNPNKIITGSDDGNVYITLDGGTNWSKISDNLPNRWVTKVLTSKVNPGTIFVTLSGYRFGTNEGHVYVSYDNGTSWIDLSVSLPDIPVNDMVQDSNGRLYLATDVGVFASGNGGENWEPLDSNLPSVVVTDMHIHEASQYLYIGTYGRSCYKMDLSQVVLGDAISSEASNFQLYPNPASDRFRVQFMEPLNGKVLIYNQLGSLVQTENLLNSNQEIYVDRLQAGLYFVSVVSEHQTIIKRLIIR